MSALQRSSPIDAASGVESTMSVKRMVVRNWSVNGMTRPVVKRSTSSITGRTVVLEEVVVGTRQEHQAGTGDGCGEVAAVLGRDDLVVLEVDDQRGCGDRREGVADVKGAVQMEQVVQLVVAGRGDFDPALRACDALGGVEVRDLAVTHSLRYRSAMTSRI